MTKLGVFVSPLARMAPLPTIGITSSPTPAYQGIMYSRMSGSVSASAPSRLKSGSTVAIPIAETVTTSSTARISESVVSRFTRSSWP
ncbi:MAG: hypothetical protein SangKO_030470 [Sandaracinaceae bacterium]